GQGKGRDRRSFQPVRDAHRARAWSDAGDALRPAARENRDPVDARERVPDPGPDGRAALPVEQLELPSMDLEEDRLPRQSRGERVEGVLMEVQPAARLHVNQV